MGEEEKKKMLELLDRFDKSSEEAEKSLLSAIKGIRSKLEKVITKHEPPRGTQLHSL